MAGDQQEAVVEEERRNGAEVSLSLSNTEIWSMEVVLRSKKIKESQIKFLLRCEDGGSCSRGRLRGLPDGKVHWKVGNCLLFSYKLIFVTFLHRFGHWGHGGGWGMREYNTWREKDGMLCRS